MFNLTSVNFINLYCLDLILHLLGQAPQYPMLGQYFSLGFTLGDIQVGMQVAQLGCVTNV
jgi:hypothetical protein